jgi:uncharacterized protein YjeT (DUF2065 family)
VISVTVAAIACLVVAVVGLLLHFTPTWWKPTIAAASFARAAMWFALPAAVWRQ